MEADTSMLPAERLAVGACAAHRGDGATGRGYSALFGVIHSTRSQMIPATTKATTIAISTGIMLLSSLLESVHIPRSKPALTCETRAKTVRSRCG